jgi:hypothetical protein
VASPEIQDGSIQPQDLGFTPGGGGVPANSVGTAEVLDGSLFGHDIAFGAISSMQIADGSIFAFDIADNAIDASKLADDSVGSSEIQQDAVGTSELAGGAATPSRQQAPSVTGQVGGGSFDQAFSQIVSTSPLAINDGVDHSVLVNVQAQVVNGSPNAVVNYRLQRDGSPVGPVYAVGTQQGMPTQLPVTFVDTAPPGTHEWSVVASTSTGTAFVELGVIQATDLGRS